MNKILLCAVAATCLTAPAIAGAQNQPLTPERVFASPSLAGPAARGVQVSPDGKLVTYLRPEATNQHKLDLWAAPTAGGESRLLVSGAAVEPANQVLSEAEKGRRERQRLAAVSGVIDYAWDEQGARLVIPAGGDLYLVEGASGAVKKLAAPGAGNSDARFSPKGRFVSYVRDQNLYAFDLTADHERAITTAGKDSVSFGVAEFVAQEEMDRYTGYWWSPAEDAIAYARVDESGVDLAPRLEVNADGATISQQRYPKAGRPNAVVQLFVQRLDGPADAAPIKVDLGSNADTYLARVAWSADGKTLYVQRQTRDQQTLDLLMVDPHTGASRVIVTEHQTPWIDLTDDFYTLKNGDFIWASERTGFNHLYLYSRDGKLIRTLTHGAWPVAGAASGAGAHAPGVAGVDETKGLVYFMASKDTPIERQLYAVSYRTPGEPTPVTTGHGWWTTTMPKAATTFVGYYSDPATPPQTALYDMAGHRLRWIEENKLDASHPFYPYSARYPAPRFGVLKAADGQGLQYRLETPADFDPAKRYPAIVDVYGGPGVQTVTRSWRSANDKLFLEAGYVVFQLDNRGSANRGAAFQAPIYKKFGTPEVDDQIVGISYLKSLPYVDPAHVGVSGWSFGGYMTLRMLTDPRTGLAAGASGAPPTDWRLYDTHYTERYMGMPQADPAAYD
ncbi:MAG: S9 family peptidase, partial [Caulobacteraceae bacterium]